MHSMKQTKFSQIPSKNGFKSFFTSAICFHQQMNVFGFGYSCVHFVFLGIKNCSTEALLEKYKGSLCRICLYFAQFNFGSFPHQNSLIYRNSKHNPSLSFPDSAVRTKN